MEGKADHQAALLVSYHCVTSLYSAMGAPLTLLQPKTLRLLYRSPVAGRATARRRAVRRAGGATDFYSPMPYLPYLDELP